MKKVVEKPINQAKTKQAAKGVGLKKMVKPKTTKKISLPKRKPKISAKTATINPGLTIKDLPKTKAKLQPKSGLKANPKNSLKAKLITSKHKVTPKAKVNKPETKVKFKPKAKVVDQGATNQKVVATYKPKLKTKTILNTKQTNIKKPKVVGHALSGGATSHVDMQPYAAKPDEEYMNPGQLQHLKNILLAWKEQLLNEAKTTKQDIQATSANFPDPVDRASLEEEFNLELRARDRERKLIKKIEETLQRIKEDSYGYCDDCGAEIGVRRLEARPTAEQCIECKTIAELKERQVGEVGREED